MNPRLPRLPARRKPDVPPIVQADAPEEPDLLDAVAALAESTPSRSAWTGDEAAVLLALAAAGGDLTAHRTVHLEDL